MSTIKDKLIEKSIEAFCMAIELYNKPTIKYRVEGFALFICNAWELMLKAHMINAFGEPSIYYRDNNQRTLSLENCVQKVFTNNKDPLRINLEKIIELRNTSTHFNFLTLSVSMKALDETEIIARYPEPIATHFIDLKTSIDELSINNNAKFAIRIDHYYYITKNKDEATNIVHFKKNASPGITVVKELQDPNNTHKYTTKSCIKIINQILKRKHIELTYNGNPTKFTSFHFTNFCKYYGLKENKKLCYIHKQYLSPQYSYSQQMIDFIVEEIIKDPLHILDNIKK